MLFNEVERLRQGALTLEQRAEAYRLKVIAIHLRSIEKLGEEILSALLSARAAGVHEPPDIPDFLRRY